MITSRLFLRCGCVRLYDTWYTVVIICGLCLLSFLLFFLYSLYSSLVQPPFQNVIFSGYASWYQGASSFPVRENFSSESTIPSIINHLPNFGMNFFRRRSPQKKPMDNHPEVIFLGDSLINRLQDAPVWEKLFASQFRCLNYGIDGLTVEGLLRRIVQGDFRMDGFQAKAVVVLIGTNNVGDSPNYIAEKIEEILQSIRQRQPDARVFIIELFPKGATPNPYREKTANVNDLLRERLKTTPKVSVTNLDPGFVKDDGSISGDDMPDFLHFSHSAYQKAFEPLHQLIKNSFSEN